MSHNIIKTDTLTQNLNINTTLRNTIKIGILTQNFNIESFLQLKRYVNLSDYSDLSIATMSTSTINDLCTTTA